MKRIQLFEFEDQTWFPHWVRAAMTNLIAVLHRLMGTKAVLAGLIAQARKKHPFSAIVDMGSGSGGIMPDVLAELNKENKQAPLELMLTDLYPNPQFIRFINEQSLPNVQYSAESLDATNLSNTPVGLKTMVASFHHMPPPQAKQILKSAQINQQPILIYEIAENNIPLLVWVLFSPISLLIVFLMAWILTPFSKPLTLRQLIFTYLIPIIPIFYAWDGQASLPRTYTIEDIQEMINDFKEDGYDWEIAAAKKKDGKKQGYYILGLPK